MASDPRQSADTARASDAEFLLVFFKALAEPARLRVAGLLAAGPATPRAVAAALDLPLQQVVKHLARLEEAGIVAALDDGQRALNERDLRAWAREALPSPRMLGLADATDERGKVLARFYRNGRLTGFPTGDARKLIILENLAARFESGRVYTEREVNDVLKAVFDDYTTLRRALVDYRFMNRERGVYWLGEGRGAGAMPATERAGPAQPAARDT